MVKKKVLLIDMYGVIIEESRGKLINYAVDCLGENNRQQILKIIREEQCHTKASMGELTSDEFLSHLGFENPNESMKDYLVNYLTLDNTFTTFAEKNCDKMDFVLLSNDILEWSDYLTSYHDINKYFKEKIISGAIHLRKPDTKIFEYTLNKIKVEPSDCIFVDNSVKNLLVAEELGIKTVLFNRDHETFNGTIVDNFEHLSALLDKRLK